MTSVLTLAGVSKSFGAARALVDVDLEVHPHEVVAVVGDNGAGKSTLAAMLAGVHQPDSGAVLVDGEPVRLASPATARQRGIAAVFQELALCDNLDVVENLFLGHELEAGPFLDEVAMERQAWELLDQLAARVPSVRMPVSALSGGQRRTVAIARALLGDPRVVVLDEPTAALGIRQTAQVLTLVERLRSRGHSVVLISHSTADVQAVADRIVVLRLGRVNGVFDADAATSEDLLAAITGAAPAAPRTRRPGAAPVEGGPR
ncbi:ATP-binding cassette domain-containing protein [Cellulomonas sp. PhB143]|uniref:ATP-binding cassette domain-containing protein n=1 Tax=Cellulomonas sp. PhB143 TaxID=2485186 RepID=UPI000F468E18|nr:ATP-binding cassette domain-containing protein [Cellulomonas sp. PhB143]ROS72135.1 simple sugar transport system ATP-binding protein/D-xylose transport system ATP-binding protein [Cellulomonas sp. PhB143]